MYFVDTHTHIYKEYYPDDFDEVVSRALNAGVTQMVVPCVNPSSIPFIREAVHAYPDHLFPLIGLHPSDVNENYRDDLKVMYEHLEDAEMIGVGEIGLDLYHERDFLKEQQKVFYTQLGWAADAGLPMSVHIRSAYPEALEVLRDFERARLRGVMHCFSGGLREAEKVIEMGFALGIGGVVTFKNSRLPDLVKEVGLEHLVLETDSPFLAPTPHRGTPNESSYVPLVAAKLAEIFEVPVEEIADVTTANAHSVFNKLPDNQ